MARNGTARSWTDRLCDVVGERKHLEAQKLKALRDEAKQQGRSLPRVLVERGMVSEEEMLGFIAQEFRIPPIHLNKIHLDPQTLKLIPETFAQRHAVIPVSRLGDRLTVAMANPLDVIVIDEIHRLTHCEVDPLLALESEIRQTLQRLASTGSEAMSEMLKSVEGAEDEEVWEAVVEPDIDLGKVTQQSKEAPIVRMVNLILAQAIQRQASDIHFEPLPDRLRVRYRVDGNLLEAFTVPKQHQNAVLARLKILSQLDITEFRLPQDGRFKVQVGNKEVDFRVSVLPLLHGGKTVLRVLDQSSLSHSLDQLGFAPDAVQGFQQALAAPYGMILITGPTGSGKSTTLYAMIRQLNEASRNIVTVEDPVEYQIEGITQTQVHVEIGLTFAAGLRAILRQTPDVVLVGEIRDAETADIAVKASLTGHLLLSTLHTNDAPGAITRLTDMGVEPFLTASSLLLVAAQRLCRRLCDQCKTPATVSAQVLKDLGLGHVKPTQTFEAKGCEACTHTGYRGRIAIAEVMTLDEELRTLVLSRPSSAKVKELTIKKGMRTLRDDAVAKWLAGATTLEEVLRVTSEE